MKSGTKGGQSVPSDPPVPSDPSAPGSPASGPPRSKNTTKVPGPGSVPDHSLSNKPESWLGLWYEFWKIPQTDTSEALKLLWRDPWGFITEDLSHAKSELSIASQVFQNDPWKFIRDGSVKSIVWLTHATPDISGLSASDKMGICRDVMKRVFVSELFEEACNATQKAVRTEALKTGLSEYPSPPLQDWFSGPVWALFQLIHQAWTDLVYWRDSVTEHLKGSLLSVPWYILMQWIPWLLRELIYPPLTRAEFTRTALILAVTIASHTFPTVYKRFPEFRKYARFFLFAFTAWILKVLFAQFDGFCIFDLTPFLIGMLISNRYFRDLNAHQVSWFKLISTGRFLTDPPSPIRFIFREMETATWQTHGIILVDIMAVVAACYVGTPAQEYPQAFLRVALFSLLGWTSGYNTTRFISWRYTRRQALPRGISYIKKVAYRQSPIILTILASAICTYGYGYQSIEWKIWIAGVYFGARIADPRSAPDASDVSLIEQILTQPRATTEAWYNTCKFMQSISLGRKVRNLHWRNFRSVAGFVTAIFVGLPIFTDNHCPEKCPDVNVDRWLGLIFLTSAPLALWVLELYCRDFPDENEYHTLIDPLKSQRRAVLEIALAVGLFWWVAWWWCWQDLPLVVLTALLWSLIKWKIPKPEVKSLGTINVPGRGRHHLYTVPRSIAASGLEINVNHDTDTRPVPEGTNVDDAVFIDPASGQPGTVATDGLPKVVINSENRSSARSPNSGAQRSTGRSRTRRDGRQVDLSTGNGSTGVTHQQRPTVIRRTPSPQTASAPNKPDASDPQAPVPDTTPETATRRPMEYTTLLPPSEDMPKKPELSFLDPNLPQHSRVGPVSSTDHNGDLNEDMELSSELSESSQQLPVPTPTPIAPRDTLDDDGDSKAKEPQIGNSVMDHPGEDELDTEPTEAVGTPQDLEETETTTTIRNLSRGLASDSINPA